MRRRPSNFASGFCGGNRASGFTLIELILALGIVVTITGVIYASISIGFRAKQTATNAVAPVRAATAAMDLVTQDLENALPPTSNNGDTTNGAAAASALLAGSTPFLGQPQSGGSASGGSAEADTLDFCCMGDDGPITPEMRQNDQEMPFLEGIRHVQLALRTDVDPPVLVRRVERNLLPTVQRDPEEEVLCRNVKSFTLEYYDGSVWTTEWDSSSNNLLPLAVRVTIELNRDKSETSSGVYRISRVVPISCATLDDGTTTGGTQ